MLHSVKTGIVGGGGQKQHSGLILSLAAWLEDSEPRGTTSG